MIDKITPAIVVFPASNCEMDMATVLKEVYHLNPELVWHDQRALPEEITHVILPGGFSFGDYLRAGAIAAFSPIMKAVNQFASNGGPVLGVCNGFQILCEAKLLPGVLLKNHDDHFICTDEPMTWFGGRRRLKRSVSMTLPIAHREGRFFADEETISALFENGQVCLLYDNVNAHGDATINGAERGIAGIVGGPNNNIIGLMPHPERMAQELRRDGLFVLDDFLFG